MPQPRIAIASCAGYAEQKADEELLREALAERGCEAVPVAWDQPGTDWGGFDLCLVKSTWDSKLGPPPLCARVDLVEGLDGLPCLIELELIEPNLYLGTHPPAAERLAEAALLRIDVDA